MRDLNLKEGVGYTLVSDLLFQNCQLCNKELGNRFYYCKDNDICICRKCELKEYPQIQYSKCRHAKGEHIHYNIVNFVFKKNETKEGEKQ